MDGLLVLDKPTGPTSHDVVARVRHLLNEPRVGHTGTLDPGASGVLPLVIGRATRLARFLSAHDKSYEAVIRLGVSTDTYDAAGSPLGRCEGPLPSLQEIHRALDAFRGRFLQQPPAFSAKKIQGRRSYALARASVRAGSPPAVPSMPEPVLVTVSHLDIIERAEDIVTLTLDCPPGFYVRSLAHDLGARLGVGAHLVALRRTRSGEFGLTDAVPLLALDSSPQGRERAQAAVIPLHSMLPTLIALKLTEEGVRRARHGQNLRPADFTTGMPPDDAARDAVAGEQVGDGEPRYRLMDPAGHLVGLASWSSSPGFLHPSLVLM